VTTNIYLAHGVMLACALAMAYTALSETTGRTVLMILSGCSLRAEPNLLWMLKRCARPPALRDCGFELPHPVIGVMPDGQVV
jgi:hypothetical protein